MFSWPNTEQFLLALLLFLPVLSIIMFSLVGNSSGFGCWFSSFCYKLSPWLFLVIFSNLLVNIYPKFSPIFVNLNIGLGLDFGIDSISLGFYFYLVHEERQTYLERAGVKPRTS